MMNATVLSVVGPILIDVAIDGVAELSRRIRELAELNCGPLNVAPRPDAALSLRARVARRD